MTRELDWEWSRGEGHYEAMVGNLDDVIVQIVVFARGFCFLFMLSKGWLVILLKEIQGIHLVSWFPGVVTFGVASPLYKVLECSGSSMMLVISDLLHFILFLIIDQVRWGTGIV